MTIDSAVPVKRNNMPKYQVLKDALLRKINSGQWTQGEQVPSEAALIEEFEVSSTTARRCLDELAKEGYLYRVQGKGTFVSHIAHVCGKKSIGILCSGLASIEHPFLRAVFGGIESNIDTDTYIVEIIPQSLFGNAPDPAKTLRHLVERRSISGLFVVSPMPAEWLDELVQSNFPIVSLGVDYKQLPIVTVMLDTEAMLTSVLEYLVGLGHKRIHIMMGRFSNSPSSVKDGYTHACESVARFMEQPSGAEVEVEISAYDWFNSEGMQQALMTCLNKPKRPTAIVTVEDTVARLTWDLARKAGLGIPKDLSIILTMTCLSSYSRVTAVAGNMENLTWRAARIMELLLEGEKPARMKEIIGGRQIAGESTGIARIN